MQDSFSSSFKYLAPLLSPLLVVNEKNASSVASIMNTNTLYYLIHSRAYKILNYSLRWIKYFLKILDRGEITKLYREKKKIMMCEYIIFAYTFNRAGIPNEYQCQRFSML